MADLTQGAVDSVVGLLSTVITNEARLLKGMQDDMQFIKDEMESMNGFLLHLTKTDRMHDDQLRAWMKQIRDISYVAQDCIELYKRDFMGPSDKGLWARLKYLPTLIVTYCPRRRLAERMSELKARVHDIGQRRERYQVKIPEVETPPLTLARVHRQDKIDEDREEFVRALARDKEKQQKQELPCYDEELPFFYKAIRPVTQFVRASARDKEKEKKKLPCFDEAIGLLPVVELRPAAIMVRRCLLKKLPHEESAAVCMEMLLRALRDHSTVGWEVEKTKGELEKLVKYADMDINDFPSQVMIFCYSKLSRSYKSCLQYLYAFYEEKAISRTSLVRRWLAEGRVEKQGDASTLKEVEEQDDASLEVAAEICFKDLLFRGFLRSADDPATATGKVKRCKIDHIVWEFLLRMSTTENFVDNLPTHLNYQLRIRRYVIRQVEHEKNHPRPRQVEHEKNHPRPRHPWGSICGCWRTPPDGSTVADPDPLGDMQKFLDTIDQFYRLNVLDLGGCNGLQKSHLKSICSVVSLKYLSLRNTDVSGLPQEINKLILLETLDIRQTQVQDMKHIHLRKLKRLLTGLKMTTEEEETICCAGAGMPRKIGEMEDMEILSRVQVRHGKKELGEVGRLLKLRKLGVVLAGSQIQAQDSMDSLLRAMTKLTECLRSLSIWVTVTPPPTNGDPSVAVNMEMEQEHAPRLLESLDIKGLRLLNTGLPHWIWALQNLSEITLCDTFLSKVSLQDLGNKLHCLRRLRLRRNSYSEPNLTFNKDGFQDLRFLIVEGNTITTVSIEQGGAAPLVKKIVWHNMAINQAGKLSGIHHLKRLQEVVLKGNFTDPSSIPHNDGCKITEA